MALCRVCNAKDLAEGEMLEVEAEGHRVLLLRLCGGAVKAYDPLCPHEGLPLAYGDFDGAELVCTAHHWAFDGTSGECIDPGGCRLKSYPVQVDGDGLFVKF